MMLYPPRAECRITTDKVHEFPADDWLSQCKMNGTAIIVFCIGGIITVMNRYGKVYAVKIKNEEFRAIFPRSKNFVVCGEYLNKGLADEYGEIVRDKFVIWDITNFDGKDLLGSTVQERIDLVIKKTRKGKTSSRPYIHKEISENVWIIQSFYDQFMEVYAFSSIPLIEGLMIKRKGAPLKPCNRPDNNTSWQVKVRKATKFAKF